MTHLPTGKVAPPPAHRRPTADPNRRRMPPDHVRVRVDMKLTRVAVVAGVAKKLYDESRKPQNQARMRAAVEKVRERRRRR